MESPVLFIEKQDTALVLTINRPQALNALNVEVIDALCNFFSDGYRAWSPFAAVIMTGSGVKAFVAGADISEFRGMDAATGMAFARKGQEMMMMIEQFHVPVIAAVNGFALGGGCELAMACHLRIASETARFGQPEVNLGLIPGYGGTQRLTQLVGKGKALELMLTGDMVDAQTALSLGLVNAVVPADQLLESCKTLVQKLTAKAPLALAKVIDGVNAHFAPGTDGYLQEATDFASLMDTEDFVEGTTAFLEKRKAQFRGA